MKITPNGSLNYGLGWFLQDWNGLKVVQHGGNIDGFNSLVAMIPEKKLGFVMLTNVSASSLGGELMPIVWENILGNPNKTNKVSADALKKEVGKYRIEGANLDIDVVLKDGKLFAIVPGQPQYELQNVGERKYQLGGAPDGFFITFKDDSAFLQQPQGNANLKKVAEETKPANSGSAKELIGSYLAPDNSTTVDVKSETDGKVTFNIPGQQPYALNEKTKDIYNLSPLPENYSLKVKRNADNKIDSVVVSQPEGEFEFKKKEGKSAQPDITTDELIAKVIEAAGGEENLRKINSRITTSEINLIHQGVKGTTISYAKTPNKTASETTMIALGKTIAKGFEYFDGQNSEESYTFAPSEKLSGKRLADTKLNADFYSLLNLKKNYKKIEIKGIEKVGEEDCYAVEFTPEIGTKLTDYYSTKTFLHLKRLAVVSSSTSNQDLPFTVIYSDYREIDGLKLPFKIVNTSISMGDIVTTVKSYQHNVPINDKIFATRKVSLK